MALNQAKMRMIVMKIWKALVATASATTLLALTACTASTPDRTGAATGGRLKVAVAFYPFQFVAERVGGDEVTVENLTPPGSEPHDLELNPLQVGSLATADLVVFQSGFQPAVDTAIKQATPKRTVDTASFLTIVHAQEEGEDGDHDSAELDPHTWLDPINMIDVAKHVQSALTDARPEAAAEFAANANTLVAELTDLDNDIKAGLAHCKITSFVTSHAAFGYFAKRYGLTQVAIRGIEPDVEPTAERIHEVQVIAKERGVTTIFFETLTSPVVAQSIAGDLGLKTDVLDPLEGITDESRGSDYLEVMRANLAALEAAGQCS